MLPKVLSKEEVKSLLKASEANEKHYLILMLLYGDGLRIGELINLKKEDLELDRKMILIRKSKGKKDRYTLLPQSIADRAVTLQKNFHISILTRKYLRNLMMSGLNLF